MNRSFKTIFHGGHKDEKAIVTMSLKVDNGKRFKDLNKEMKKALVNDLVEFIGKVEQFAKEVSDSI